MSNESNQNNIFINGRQQIIEMLQYMEEGGPKGKKRRTWETPQKVGYFVQVCSYLY